jgi:phage-related protein
VLTREHWVAAAMSYDPSQVEVILSSAIDAVGATAPTRTLTSKLVGSLPLTGAIQNL